MKYITLFETLARYQSVSYTLDTPNVSLIEATMEVNYLPIEKRVICKYNVTSTSSPTALRTNYEQNIFKTMEIDGVMLDNLVTEYTFDTTGIHTVKYELYDETKLGSNAPVFNNSNLIECIIPNSVTIIDMNTFLNCSSLTSINIPSGVTRIGSGAFYGCSGLTSIDIPDSVTSINGSSFFNCSSLRNCTIGNSVTSIGDYAFQNCTGLTSIVIPNSVTTIGNYAFYFCSSLTSIDIPDSVTSIGGYVFYGCSGLTSCIIGSGVTTISNSVFSNCTSLTSCTIGSGVTSIGQYAFSNCSGLTNITSNRTTAPTIDSTTFNGIKTGGTLTVPIGSSGYDTWMQNTDYYLGKYEWTKIEQ